VGSGWRLATSQVERVGFPAGSRWSAEGRNKWSFKMRTLSGWGARYTEKKARREVSNFCVTGSRIFREVWVTVFA
jgi:hypothetical protein